MIRETIINDIICNRYKAFIIIDIDSRILTKIKEEAVAQRQEKKPKTPPKITSTKK